ncbi:hypothetical protein GALMADRAFT_592158 [Galerina marginata CBS 339.88]|uniref:Uncharacterized protein n=1 Tax=Galerina marginata (strain CBS 339.88) TaxID=685588 RepID=A0A067T474_GALM3|nr:hypothetical protein GALMADRAFT_592158 [Galerina marginata CBS 339.88]
MTVMGSVFPYRGCFGVSILSPTVSFSFNRRDLCNVAFGCDLHTTSAVFSRCNRLFMVHLLAPLVLCTYIFNLWLSHSRT